MTTFEPLNFTLSACPMHQLNRRLWRRSRRIYKARDRMSMPEALLVLRPTMLTCAPLCLVFGALAARGLISVQHTREYFYTGGHYVNTSGGFVYQGQMYVEHLSPIGHYTWLHLPPIIFIHGAGQTGTNFLNTPDGRPGWSSYFLERGYQVYLLDQPYRARSPWSPRNASDLLTAYPAERIETRFTAPERAVLWPQAKLHTQWPGKGVRGDPIFDSFYSSNVPIPYLSDPAYLQIGFRAAITDLLTNHICRPAFVVAHSQGGVVAWQAPDSVPELVKGLIALEPTGPPFFDQVFTWDAARAYGISDAPIAYDPPIFAGDAASVRAQFNLVTTPSSDPAVSNCTLQSDVAPRKLVQIAKVPVLVVTSEASFHRVYDWCTVDFLRQAGVKVDFTQLDEKGIRGNGHMFFMEKNSDRVAGIINEWLRNHSR